MYAREHPRCQGDADSARPKSCQVRTNPTSLVSIHRSRTLYRCAQLWESPSFVDRSRSTAVALTFVPVQRVPSAFWTILV